MINYTNAVLKISFIFIESAKIPSDSAVMMCITVCAAWPITSIISIVTNSRKMMLGPFGVIMAEF